MMHKNVDPKEQKIQLLWLAVAVLVSFSSCLLCMKIFFNGESCLDILLGWLLALVFNLSGLLIKLAAVGQDIRKFFFFTFIAAPANIFLFLGVVIFTLGRFGIDQKPFVSAVFIAYSILLVYDMLLLQKISVASDPQKARHV